MTSRARKFSISDPTLFAQTQDIVKEWIENVTHEKLPTDKPLQEILADGTVLCSVINALKPNTIKRYHVSPKIAALKLENAGAQLVSNLITCFARLHEVIYARLNFFLSVFLIGRRFLFKSM